MPKQHLPILKICSCPCQAGPNSPQAIYKWQNGTALPTVDNFIALAALLHVRIDDILITDHSVA